MVAPHGHVTDEKPLYSWFLHFYVLYGVLLLQTALTKAGVRIFQQASRNSNMIVHLCMSDEGAVSTP